MAMIIKTSDGGEIETGFWGPDISKIQLGELPPITTQQFVGYAALVLTENIVPKLDAGTRAEWARDARSLRERVEDASLRSISGKFITQGPDELAPQIDTAADEDLGELFAELPAAVGLTDQAEYYRESPFRVQADGQKVGFVYEDEVRHVVGSQDFFNLAYNVIGGGFMGWSKYGTYQEVKDAAVQIDTALSNS